MLFRSVADYKRDPKAFEKIGSGVDFRALDAGDGKVLKVPKDLTQDDDMFRVAPALVEHAGMGPKTKTIQAGDKSYMLQDRVTPLDSITKKAYRSEDKQLDDIYRQIDDMWKNVDIHNEKAVQDMNANPRLQALQNAVKDRQYEILKNNGFDVDKMVDEYRSLPENQRSWIAGDETKIKENPEEGFESMMQNKANQKLGNVIQPNDLHSGNVGFDAKGEPTAFDTSRFYDLKADKLSPEQRKAIMDANIATPGKKAALERLINPSKVAAVGAMPTSTELLSKPATDLAELYQKIRQPINTATRKTGEYISDLVTPKGMLNEEQAQRQRDLAGGISQVALDPANLLTPGAGLAVEIGRAHV